jgi:large subunit ribosomal protein L19
MNEENKGKEKRNSVDLMKLIENKYSKENPLGSEGNQKIKVGDIITIGYSIPEGEKERIQSYEGLIISIQNRGLGKSFTLRRTVQGIGIEQIFVANSPKILSITKKQSSKVRRAKLYFMRFLNGKSTRLKRKF